MEDGEARMIAPRQGIPASDLTTDPSRCATEGTMEPMTQNPETATSTATRAISTREGMTTNMANQRGAKTAPLAICRASLKALGAEVPA